MGVLDWCVRSAVKDAEQLGRIHGRAVGPAKQDLRRTSEQFGLILEKG